jgi:methionyl aminopeptidase
MEKEVLQSYKKAGLIAAKARDYCCSLVKEGESLLEVTKKTEEKILSMGGDFAFPPQISLNNIAAHFYPAHDDNTVFKEGDVAKVDVGVHIGGFVGDTARTVVLSNNQKLKLLQEASKKALESAIRTVKPGVTLSEIGKNIQEEITKRGFAPIKNLTGHGLGQWQIHTSPSVPNFDTGSQTELTENQVIAIEPFASTGEGKIFESSNPELFSLSGQRPVRSPLTREVLRTIEEYNDLPFAKRWLIEKHGLGKTSFALRELDKLGVLEKHPPLPDGGEGIVSQAEHTVIIKDKPIFTTRLDDE